MAVVLGRHAEKALARHVEPRAHQTVGNTRSTAVVSGVQVLCRSDWKSTAKNFAAGRLPTQVAVRREIRPSCMGHQCMTRKLLAKDLPGAREECLVGGFRGVTSSSASLVWNAVDI